MVGEPVQQGSRQPLKRGGADEPSNMQWQTIEVARAKDKVEEWRQANQSGRCFCVEFPDVTLVVCRLRGQVVSLNCVSQE